MLFRMAQSLFCRLCRSVRPFVLYGYLERLEVSVVTEYSTHEHDVLVIGAGGAGLRAAASTAAGVKSRGHLEITAW